jgi:hypothetical protein
MGKLSHGEREDDDALYMAQGGILKRIDVEEGPLTLFAINDTSIDLRRDNFFEKSFFR